MPFKEHSRFQSPDSKDSNIWRYMNLAKYLSLLEKRCLYFTRLDQLYEMDPFEGHYSHINMELHNSRYQDLPDDLKKRHHLKNETVFNKVVESQKYIFNYVNNAKKATFVNSWHMKEHESVAMWKIYSCNNEGISIQSTYQRLKESLSSCDEFQIYIGLITYKDYITEEIPMGNLYYPFMHKRKYYEYENELRALICTKDNFEDNTPGKYDNFLGLHIPIDIERLIENVYVASNAPKWMLDVIKKVTIKYGINIEVKQSDLSSSPVTHSPIGFQPNGLRHTSPGQRPG